MTKRPARNSLILTGVFLMFLCGGLTDSSAQETWPHLIAPIFPQSEDLDSDLYIAVGECGNSRLDLDEYNSIGISRYGASYPVEDNEVTVHHGHVDFATGGYIVNGWIRIRYPEIHLVHAMVKTWRRSHPETPFISQVVRAAPVFRLIGEVSPRGETGISIVNPTPNLQSVKITFHQVGAFEQFQRRGYVELDKWQKASRFLSELVDLEGLERNSRGGIQGLVRIEGEEEIAVAAVGYSRATNWFHTVPVAAE